MAFSGRGKTPGYGAPALAPAAPRYTARSPNRSGRSASVNSVASAATARSGVASAGPLAAARRQSDR